MNKKITLLLAEDEEALGKIVKESLETRDFTVLWAKNGKEALNIYKTKQPEILVLDVMMPKQDGFSLARKIRLTDNSTPIIFLTAKTQTTDVVEGFGAGGNDYLKKPFSIEELIVRVKSLLRQKQVGAADNIFKIGQYLFDFTKQSLQFKGNNKVDLTSREAQLLRELVLHKNQLTERTETLKKLWGNDDFFQCPKYGRLYFKNPEKA